MKLWIVVNHFLRSSKFMELESRFERAAKELSVDYRIVTNMECMSEYRSDSICTGVIPADGNPVLFWDKDIILARSLEKNGHRLYNRPDAIEICDNKILSGFRLAASGINMPVTVPAPMTYSNIGYTDTSFVERAANRLGYPVIVKEAFGSFGAQVYKADNYSELKSITDKISSPFLLQEYIKSSYGRDIRLQVVGDRVVTSMYRYSDNDFRANVTNGGSMKPYTPDDAQCELAVRAVKALGLDFAGVDVLFGEEDEPVLCEVNSNAHFKNIDECTGSDIAREIIGHIIRTF